MISGFLQHPETGRGNSTRLGGLAGVDWRGAGGYIVAPGSARADGASRYIARYASWL